MLKERAYPDDLILSWKSDNSCSASLQPSSKASSVRSDLRLTPTLTSLSQLGRLRFRETRVACEALPVQLLSTVS